MGEAQDEGCLSAGIIQPFDFVFGEDAVVDADVVKGAIEEVGIVAIPADLHAVRISAAKRSVVIDVASVGDIRAVHVNRQLVRIGETAVVGDQDVRPRPPGDRVIRAVDGNGGTENGLRHDTRGDRSENSVRSGEGKKMDPGNTSLRYRREILIVLVQIIRAYPGAPGINVVLAPVKRSSNVCVAVVVASFPRLSFPDTS